jgi:hypothetical protein
MFCTEQNTHFPELMALSPVADVVRVLSHHDLNQVEAAVLMIFDQCHDVPAKRVAYAAARAIPALLDALRVFPAHSGVQEMVCRALWAICMHNTAYQVRIACN